ncbi:uncharacterized protein LOC109709356 [Ananas comosus]|uniref:Uncharacterized protein LOC109709356 n=1 Tax=Ananas comosus TaxID=4615 RepID=A0A6P5F0Y5_ANACO|nr:uncharacterized protein LOC109709356 [Ananas comosus]XP_020087143.1 uncharacterized protein LOC109709356 [Ananas comosus]XP_020087144.1 uncharacterized protein LOC109709356 [Ananas comosus]
MVSGANGKRADEIQEESVGASAPNDYSTKDHVALYINTSQRGLVDEEKHSKNYRGHLGFAKFGSFGSNNQPTSSASKFYRIKDERNDPSGQPSCTSFRVPFIRKIDWVSLFKMSKEWIKDPVNLALFVWITGVAISGAILFLVMTGMLNKALPEKSQRDTWFEVNNQILNALFTLMCLYRHPKLFHHLALLIRWRSDDVLKLRKIYCKNGTEKPNERKHMMVVVILLHLNCFSQYALCGLNLGYPRSKRPAIGVGLCLSLSIGAAAAASVYNILSPLGKDYETGSDQESSGRPTPTMQSFEKRFSFMAREGGRVPETNPQWVGGLFDFWDDISLAYLSIFCSCCVFGWNMDRLGFGNMYVHVATFLLFCLAPFFIFNLAAVNLNNEAIREALGLTGFVLCIFGLLYGGFWRIQMRKKFNLPGNNFCCGRPNFTDCFQWLCCCWCSLAQEVRTADYYDVVEDKFYLKERGGENGHRLYTPPPEVRFPQFRSNPVSPFQGDVNGPVSVGENSTSPLRFAGAFASQWPAAIAEEGPSERVK